MMKKFTLSIFYLFSLSIIIPNVAFSQENEYTSDNCGASQGFAVPCTSGSIGGITITVTGEGTMGVDNYGIVEAFIDIDQPNFFEGEVYLVSPDDQEFLLASSVEGISSFPQYSGTNNDEVLNVRFRNCPSLPATDTNIEPSGMTFYPVDAFSSLNDGVSSANGDWFFKFCTLDPFEYIEIFCASVTFGTICPEITNATVVDASCPSSNDGSVTFDHVVGACADEFIVFSIDGVDYQDSNTFGSLAPGNYTGHIGLAEITGPPSFNGNTSTGEYCITTFPFTIGSNDTEAPVFVDCPANITVSTDEFCSAITSVIDPTASDNCGIASGTATLVDPIGNTAFSVPLSSGNAFNYGLEILGDYTLTFTAEDESGNSTTCETIMTLVDDIAPIWTNQSITIDIECGVDDIEEVVADNLALLTATDNCSTTTITFDSNNVTSQCGNTEWNDWFYSVTDENGNTNPEFGSILINVNDNTPPVLSGIPANVTINCNDDYPDMPTLTAIDACEGDISDQIGFTINEGGGSCNLNENASSTTYTYSVADGCGNSVTADWTVTVFNDMAVDLGDDIVGCIGATETISASGLSGTYLWSTGETTPSITVGNEGTYTVTVTGTSGCCSTDDVVVTYEALPDASATGGTLNCSGDPIILTGSSTSSGVIYSWSGPGGFSSDEQNPEVSQAGTYTLTVSTAGGCTTSDDAVVDSNTDVPNISTGGGTIDCTNTEVQLSGSSSTANVTYAWTGPSGFTSSQQNPTVSIPGNYNLVVTSSNECIAEGLAVVIDDTAAPSLTIADGNLNCNNTSVTLTPDSDGSDLTYAWTGPNGYTSSTENPVVDEPGTYNLTITAPNGCTNTSSAAVSEDVANPQLTATGDAIDCTNTIGQLSSESSTTGVTFSWTGPSGFSSTAQNPTTMAGGDYTVEVTASNGCTNMATVSITVDNTLPSVSLSDDEINCTNSEITLDLSTTGNGNTFAWAGPGGFSSTVQNPTVDQPGTYAVVVTSSNGCSAEASAEIAEDIATPNASASGGSIDCDNNTVQLSGSSTTANVSYSWTGPNAFNSTIQNPTVGSAGTYTLTVTAPNGCVTSTTAEVTSDGDLPDISASGGMLTCDITEVQLMGSSTSTGVTFEWAGPNNFSSSANNPTISSPGIYTLTVSAPNGCESSTQVNILQDVQGPAVVAVGGTITCDESSLTITTSTSSDVTYAWSGPNGFSSTEANPTVTEAGTYTLVATGENGCESTTTAVVEQDDNLPSASLSIPNVDCEAGNVLLEVETDEDLSYIWTFNDNIISTSNTVTVSAAGSYEVLITSDNGCTVTFSYELEENVGSLDADITTTDATDGANGAASINVKNTVADVNILWDNGQTGESATGLSAGDHTVTVTDALGCEFTFVFTVQMSTAVGEIEILESFDVYPTLFQDRINVEATFSKTSDIQIFIIDNTGRVVRTISPLSTMNINETIDLYNLSSGVYILALQVEGQIKTKKIVKM